MTLPNFKDPRTRRRCERVLGFVAACFSPEKTRPAARTWLDQHFGQQHNSLSRWLRDNLLITVNDHYDHLAGRCKTYQRDTQGMQYVRACLANDFRGTRQQWRQQRQRDPESRDFHTEAVVWCHEAFLTELQELRFEYLDKSSRLWHPLQSVRRPIKIAVQAQAGLTHHYDIESAALTLLLQHSQRIPLELTPAGEYLQGPMDLWLWAVQDYLTNKTQRRETWARDLEISVTQIKEIITALVAGARMTARRQGAIFTMLGHDQARFQALQQHPGITALRQDLRVIWDYLKWVMPRRRVSTRRGPRWQAISSRDKWNLYFRLERSVLDQVTRYLNDHDNPCFLEHDGWATRDPIDVSDLQQYIRLHTGFDVNIESKHY